MSGTFTRSQQIADLCRRNRELAFAGRHQHLSSRSGVILYSPLDDASAHGNFYPAAWRAIQARPEWTRRLEKMHAGAHRRVRDAYWQRPQRMPRELDSCTSSDALLMNVFCTPATLRSPQVWQLLDVNEDATPHFGARAHVPLRNGKNDATEVDMRLGDLFVEAKLTEADFQRAPAAKLERYRDFDEVFDAERLFDSSGATRGYQLCRNILAVHARGGRFCALIDQRRADLRDLVAEVLGAIRLYELKTRVTVLTWQELAQALPRELARWLDAKYGIS